MTKHDPVKPQAFDLASGSTQTAFHYPDGQDKHPWYEGGKKRGMWILGTIGTVLGFNALLFGIVLLAASRELTLTDFAIVGGMIAFYMILNYGTYGFIRDSWEGKQRPQVTPSLFIPRVVFGFAGKLLLAGAFTITLMNMNANDDRASFTLSIFAGLLATSVVTKLFGLLELVGRRYKHDVIRRPHLSGESSTGKVIMPWYSSGGFLGFGLVLVPFVVFASKLQLDVACFVSMTMLTFFFILKIFRYVSKVNMDNLTPADEARKDRTRRSNFDYL